MYLGISRALCSHSLAAKERSLAEVEPSLRPREPLTEVATPRARAMRGAARLHAYEGGDPSSPRARPFRLPPMGVSPRTDTWRMALEVPQAVVA